MFKSLSDRFYSDDYHKVLSLLLIFAFVIIAMGIGLRGPWPADEPRFAEAAKEMVVSGNWFFPLRGGELYPDKPPIFMWAIAFFYWLTKSIYWSFLIPNALAGLLTLVCVYDIAAKLWNVRVARNAFLLLLTIPQFVLQAKSAQIDAMVTCWITVAMYGFIRHYFIKQSWFWYGISWAFMGLGIITKGVGFLPIFFLIPALTYSIRGGQTSAKRAVGEILFGIICMLLVLSAWFFPMLHWVEVSHNPDYIAYRDNILFKQTAERYADSWTHLKPWYHFILEVIPGFWFPMSLFLFSKSFWKKYHDDKVVRSLLIWVVLVVFFFSMSPGKRGVYILPAVPMLALCFSQWISEQSVERWIQRLIKGVCWIFNLAFFVIAILLLNHNKGLIKNLGDNPNITGFAIFFIAVGVIWFAINWFMHHKQAICQFGALMATTWILYSSWGYVLLDPIRTPAKDVMENAANAIGPNGQLAIVNYREQFLLYSPVELTQFSYLAPVEDQYRNAWRWIQEHPNRYVIGRDNEGLVCFDADKAKYIGEAHRRDWYLFDRDSILPNCDEPTKVKRYVMPFAKHAVTD
ncbi:phospholipid carrier-dependent glycosyltransferase [Vibrio sp. CAIM 722]|uniref:Phospholipid carrier-dependent glycosyltransferase n=1 Tax=Vibrio eleionomae TaxID=2653505 RepID=A0A7X4RTG9_9VIBR|nr:glycosyltransferase family 39 protein [Vibrio eleionomae]MZI92423.1 phospholipid carrier-dependent glycosyltransferase [Vibrio eleionomae]